MHPIYFSLNAFKNKFPHKIRAFKGKKEIFDVYFYRNLIKEHICVFDLLFK
jgi:hypothetical protein